MERELISVIVPVYRVEKYLKECLDSILAQTYHNLEIILVDDGSPDKCGEICERYAEIDERIFVIHQKNAGLSVARNEGLSASHGEYIMFVDSDDWIEDTVIEDLFMLCKKKQAQIAVCGFLYYDGNRKKGTWEKQQIIYDTDSALEALCRDSVIKNFAWGKLYKRSLFDGVLFPQGQLFEDINTIYRTFLKSEYVVYSGTIGYYYRIRKGAITQIKNIHHALQRITAQQQRYVDLAEQKKELEPILRKQLLYAYVMLAKSWKKAKSSERKMELEAVCKAIEFWENYKTQTENVVVLDRIEKIEYKCLLKKREKAFMQLICLDYLHKITKRIPISF